MPILQAPPTSQPVTPRAAALARGDGSARATVAAPQPGERGHLRHTLLAAIAVRHYSRRTAQAYWHWTRQFILWSGKQHPLDMGAPEVGAFLTHLAADRDVSASTQRQALAALLFLYKQALQVDLPWVDDIVRAKQPQRLPVVLTRDEVARLWQQIPQASIRGLVLRLLYGAGLRLTEGLRLRMQDVDIKSGSITVRAGKGNKDRVVMLPRSLAGQLADVIREYSAQATVSAATVKVRMAYLRAACRWAWKTHNLGQHDPGERATMPAVRNERHRYIGRREVLRLAREVSHRDARAVVLVAFYSGMRLSECLRARPEAGHWVLDDTKNGERRIVPIHPKTARLAQRWPRPVPARTVQSWFLYAIRRLGIEDLRFHDLRHSAASAMINAGVPVYTVGAVLGHKAAASTKRYSHLDTAALADAVKRIG